MDFNDQKNSQLQFYYNFDKSWDTTKNKNNIVSQILVNHTFITLQLICEKKMLYKISHFFPIPYNPSQPGLPSSENWSGQNGPERQLFIVSERTSVAGAQMARFRRGVTSFGIFFFVFSFDYFWNALPGSPGGTVETHVPSFRRGNTETEQNNKINK